MHYAHDSHLVFHLCPHCPPPTPINPWLKSPTLIWIWIITLLCLSSWLWPLHFNSTCLWCPTVSDPPSLLYLWPKKEGNIIRCWWRKQKHEYHYISISSWYCPICSQQIFVNLRTAASSRRWPLLIKKKPGCTKSTVVLYGILTQGCSELKNFFALSQRVTVKHTQFK